MQIPSSTAPGENESRLHRLSQLYLAQSQINDAVARATDFHQLCDDVCRIVVDTGNIACALVRLLDDSREILLPVAFHGPHVGLVGRRELPVNQPLGVSAVAFRTGKPVVVDDTTRNPITPKIGPAAAEFNVRSAAAYPLLSNGKAFGTFALFAIGTHFFDDELSSLLEKTANILAFAHDKLAADAARAEIDRRNREMIELSPMAIRIIQDGHIVMINRAGLDQLGYASFEEIGSTELENFIHPDHRQLAASMMSDMLASGSNGYTREYINRHRDGHYYPVEVTARPFTFNGRPAVLAYIHNLTERRRAEQSLRESETRYKLAVGAAEVGIWDWNLVTGVAYLSEEYCRMFGYQQSELAGTLDTMRMLTRPQDRDKTIASLQQQWKTGIAKTDYEQPFVCKDGSIKWVLIRAQIVERGPDGQGLRMIGTATDLTERKERERRILQLSRLNSALGKINAAVARVTDFATLASDACRIAVEEGGFISAVIRTVDTALEQLTQIGEAGLRDGFLGLSSISLTTNKGVTTRAFHDRKPVVVYDLANDPLTSYAIEDGKRLGINAGVAFPLIVGGVPIGTITVWGRNASFIDEQNLNLLQQMVDAVAFAHAKLEADAAVVARERDTQLAQEAGNIGSVIIDLRAGKWTTSRVGFTVLGLPPAEWYPLASFEGMLAPETREATMKIMRANIASGKATHQDYEFIRASDGARRWLRVITDSEFDAAGKALRRIGTLQDVTDEHDARRRIERTTRLYAALSKTNETIVRSSDFESVAAAVCAIAVEDGGLSTAVIRLHDPARNVLRRIARAGITFGMVGSEDLPMNEEDGLAVNAFRQGKAVQASDLNQVYSALGKVAAEVGLKAAVSYPLRDAQARSFGTFTIFASDVQSFDNDIVGLLQEIADALSLAFTKYQTDAALASSQRDLEIAQEAGRIGSTILDVNTGTWVASRVTCEILGLPEGPARPISTFLDLLTPASRETALTSLRTSLHSVDTTDNIYEIIHPTERTSRWIRAVLAGERGPDGSVVRRLGTVQDVTKQQLSEQRANHLSRLYSALSDTNESIIHAADFDSLCKAVCQIVVEVGGIVASAVRIYDAESDALVEIAGHGPRKGLMNRREIPVNEERGVSNHAFRLRKPVLVPNLAEDPRTLQAAVGAREVGAQAAAAFPLMAGDTVFGIFSVWAADGVWLEQQLADLLREIAEAISFGRAKLISDAALVKSERELALAQQIGNIGTIIMDINSLTWSATPIACQILGIESGEERSLASWDALMEPAGREQVLNEMHAKLHSGKPAQSVYTFTRPSDGQRRWISINAITEFDARGVPLRRIGTMIDITEQQLAEQQLMRANRLYLALSKTNEAVMHASQFSELADATVRLVVERGGMVAAAIRLHDKESNMLREVSAHGPRVGLIARSAVGADDTIGVASAAFREGRRVIVPNMQEHEITRPAAADAAKLGITAAAGFPIRSGDWPVGTVTVFATDSANFDEQMADLLQEIADALGYALSKMQSERSRSDAEARVSAIVESAMDAIITVDETMRIVVFNKAAQSMFDCPNSEAIGTSLERFLPMAVRDQHAKWMNAFADQQMGSRPMGRAQVTALRANGHEFPAEASISHTTLDGQRFFTVIMRDITAAVAAKRALSDAERRYRNLVEGSLNSVLLIHGEIIEYANPSTARMLGVAHPSVLVGTSLMTYIAPRHQDASRDQIIRGMQRPGQSMDRQWLQMQQRNGNVIDTYATAQSIDVEGRTLLQVELRDVTRERQAVAEMNLLLETLESRVAARTEELTLSNRELEAANRDLESFSYSVAHDLRAPLRSIIGFSELLDLDVADKEYEDLASHTSRIISSARRMNELIDGLLTVSRVTHGTLGDDPVNMEQLARDAVSETQPADKVNIKLGKLPGIHGDVLSIRQVWANLVSNAVKYSSKREHPEIDIGCVIKNGEAIFHVRDNGAGFDPAYADRLFGVFQRLHKQEDFDGTGVGLAVVRRVVERHGGRVWAEAEYDKGATFYFALPEARLIKAG